MATVDPIELPSGVRHGTPEGHLAGCKGERANCPALAEHGMSCTYAYVRSTTTPDRYFKAKARNPEPREIARTLGFRPTTPEQALADVVTADAQLPAPRKYSPAPPRERTAPMPAPEPKPADTATPRQIRAWALEHGIECPTFGRIPAHIRDAYNADSPNLAQAAAPTPTPAVDTDDNLPPHGTTRRYHKGCRDNCPGDPDTGLTCRQTAVERSRENRQKREQAGSTNAAQPLAERSQDPSDYTPTPVDEVAAATPQETPAEGEDMGHHHVEATAELIDQVRDRIDMLRPEPIVDDLAVDRPEWADVAISEDVNRAIAERDQAIAERDRARSLAIALDQAHDAAIARAEIAESSLGFTLARWATLHQALGIALQKIHDAEKLRAEGWARAYRATRLLDEIRDYAQANPGSTIHALAEAQGDGVRITPPQPRRTWWRKNAR